MRDYVGKLQAESGVNYVLAQMMFGDLSFDEASHSIRLFAREVMPAFTARAAADGERGTREAYPDLPGDGIGPEILAQSRRVVEWFAARRGLDIDLREELFGIPAWHAHGSLLRDETWAEIERPTRSCSARSVRRTTITSPASRREPAFCACGSN